MGLQVLFWMTLAATLVAVVIFNRAWQRGLSRSTFTYPFEVFTYLYFVVVPAVNIIYDEYVARSLFFGEPVRAMVYLNVLNCAGLLLAGLSAACITFQAPPRKQEQTSAGHVRMLLTLALVASLVWGFYNNFVAFNLSASGDAVVEAGIAKYALIEAAPMLLAWLIVVNTWMRGKRPSAVSGLMLLALFAVIAIAMNFSRGSRVTVLLVTILGLQLFHLHVVRLRRGLLLASLLIGLVVFHLMTVYKHVGIQGIGTYLTGGGVPTYLSERYTSPVRIVIGDIGRSDIQASLLEAEASGQLPHVHGKTYLKALTLVLPDRLDPFPADWSKVTVGAAAQISIDPGAQLTSQDTWGLSSSRIYGMTGEALLNFGWFGALLSFAVMGLVTRCATLFVHRSGSWERALVAPVISIIPIFILFYDLDNIIFRVIMILGLPGGLLLVNRLLREPIASRPASFKLRTSDN